MQTLKFEIEINSFDAVEFKRLKEAREQVKKIEDGIRDAYLKSDRFQAVMDLAGYGDYGTKYNPITCINGTRIVTNVQVDLEGEKPKPLQPYIPEKTVNMLLSGKLLNDDQKKALLKRIGFDLDELNTPAA